MTELAALAAEQWGELTRDEQREASAEYRAALAQLGVKGVGRDNLPRHRPQVGDDVIDPGLERIVDEAGLPQRVASAVKRLLGGAALRPAASGSGVSHETLRAIARRVFGAPVVEVVAAIARDRALAWRSRVERLTNTEGVRLSPQALLA